MTFPQFLQCCETIKEVHCCEILIQYESNLVVDIMEKANNGQKVFAKRNILSLTLQSVLAWTG